MSNFPRVFHNLLQCTSDTTKDWILTKSNLFQAFSRAQDQIPGHFQGWKYIFVISGLFTVSRDVGNPGKWGNTHWNLLGSIGTYGEHFCKTRSDGQMDGEMDTSKSPPGWKVRHNWYINSTSLHYLTIGEFQGDNNNLRIKMSMIIFRFMLLT